MVYPSSFAEYKIIPWISFARRREEQSLYRWYLLPLGVTNTTVEVSSSPWGFRSPTGCFSVSSTPLFSTEACSFPWRNPTPTTMRKETVKMQRRMRFCRVLCFNGPSPFAVFRQSCFYHTAKMWKLLKLPLNKFGSLCVSCEFEGFFSAVSHRMGCPVQRNCGFV